MGHNVVSATMSGRIDQYEEARGQHALDNNDDNDVSSWIPEDENYILEQLHCEDPYSDRRIGEKRKP